MKTFILKKQALAFGLFFSTFSASVFAVQTATNLSPNGASVSVTNGTSFSWSAPGSTNNRILISQDRYFSGWNESSRSCDGTCFTTTTNTSTSYSKPGFNLADHTYYWKVRSNYPDGSEWSAVSSFTTDADSKEAQRLAAEKAAAEKAAAEKAAADKAATEKAAADKAATEKAAAEKAAAEKAAAEKAAAEQAAADKAATEKAAAEKAVAEKAAADKAAAEQAAAEKAAAEQAAAEKAAAEKIITNIKEPITCDDGAEVASKSECDELGLEPTHGLTQPLDSTLDDQMEGSVLGQCVYGGYCVSTVMTKVHNGVDIMLDVGTPVYAVCDGTVKSVAKKTVAIANRFMIIDHSGCGGYEKLFAYYGYIDPDLSIKNGAKVEAGQQIGTVAKQSSSRLALSFNSNFVPKELGYTVVKQKTAKDCKEESVLKRREQLDAKGWLDPIIEGAKSGWNPVLLSGGSVKTGCDATEQQYIPEPNGTTLPYAPWERTE